MRTWVLGSMVLFAAIIFAWLANDQREVPIAMESSLRLTEDEVVEFKRRAASGDHDAANALAMHFGTFESEQRSSRYWQRRSAELGPPAVKLQYAEYLIKRARLDAEDARHFLIEARNEVTSSSPMRLLELIERAEADNFTSDGLILRRE